MAKDPPLPHRPRDASLQTDVLVRRAREGDAGALSDLLNRYQARTLRVVRRRLGARLRSYLESRDVVQDVMVEVIRSLRDFTPRTDRSFFRWLTAVIENRLRNGARRASRRPIELVSEDRLDRSRKLGDEAADDPFECDRDLLSAPPPPGARAL